MSEEGFGATLRRERERRQIALSSICSNSKIKVSIFEGLERDDVSKWPAGIFRRAFVRAYAEGVGLDPEVVTQEFLKRFPEPGVPPVVSAQSTPAKARPAASAALANPESAAGPAAMLRSAVALPSVPSPAPAQLAAAPDAGIRLTLADPDGPFIGGRILASMRQRWLAIACDGGVVLALAAIVFAASGKFWLPFGIAMLCYYLGGILLLGNTPGVCLLAPGTRRPDSRATIITARAAGLKVAFALLARLNRSASVPNEGTSRP